MFVLKEILDGWSPRVTKALAIHLAPQAKEPLSFNHTLWQIWKKSFMSVWIVFK